MPRRQTSPPRSARRVALYVASSGYGQGILAGVSDYARFRPDLQLVPFFRKDAGSVQCMLAARPDGVIAHLRSDHHREGLLAARLPVVSIGSRYKDLPFPRVASDDVAVGRMAAEHLMHLGLRNLAFYGFDGVWTSELRARGFRQAALAGRCRFYHHSLVLDYSVHGQEALMRSLAGWLSTLPRPIGVMGYHDDYAHHLLLACWRAGLRVPDDVALVGADNNVHMCPWLDPPMSSVMLDAHEIGYKAVELLDHLMSGGSAPPQPMLIAPKGVAVRRSTDRIAVEDPELNQAIRFIRERLEEDITVEQVLEQLSISHSSLWRKFSKTLGVSPRQVIQQARIESIKHYLATTSMTLPRIAAATGFGYVANLSRAFKRTTGLTPGEFRRQCRATETLRVK